VILSAVDAIGVAGVEISRFTNGLPDSGHPSNSLSSSWTVGNVGMLFMMARLTWDVAAGADHGWTASYPSSPANLYGLEIVFFCRSPKAWSEDWIGL
jgi:hypothetical protein